VEPVKWTNVAHKAATLGLIARRLG
jgi:hypothetical protein